MSVYFRRSAVNSSSAIVQCWGSPILDVQVLWTSSWGHDAHANGGVTRHGIAGRTWRVVLLMTLWLWTGWGRLAMFAETEHWTESFQEKTGRIGVLLLALACLALVVDDTGQIVRWRRWARWWVIRKHFIHVHYSFLVDYCIQIKIINKELEIMYWTNDDIRVSIGSLLPPSGLFWPSS